MNEFIFSEILITGIATSRTRPSKIVLIGIYRTKQEPKFRIGRNWEQKTIKRFPAVVHQNPFDGISFSFRLVAFLAQPGKSQSPNGLIRGIPLLFIPANLAPKPWFVIVLRWNIVV